MSGWGRVSQVDVNEGIKWMGKNDKWAENWIVQWAKKN